MKPIMIVQGGQYGSEGKGQIVAWLARQGMVDYCVRTGSINAGHTLYFGGDHTQFKMQQIPCGWVDPTTQLIIGPGAYIHVPTLGRELEELRNNAGYDVGGRLFIDSRCGMHYAEHQMRAQDINRHLSIGATGKGCAEAIVYKIEGRGSGAKNFGMATADGEVMLGLPAVNTVDILNRAVDMDQRILLEGTQGTHLDLHLGPYPYTTSRMTTAANWVAEAGLSPGLDYRVIVVVRTFPIRVAGNSGPLPREATWPDLWRAWRTFPNSKAPAPSEEAIDAYEMLCDAQLPLAAYDEKVTSYRSLIRNPDLHEKYRQVLSEGPSKALDGLSKAFHDEIKAAIEMTTVTHKPRRIAEIDYDVLARTAAIERPWGVVVTFLNYAFPDMWGATRAQDLSNSALNYLHYIGSVMGAPVVACTTGPYEENVIMLGRGLYR